MYDSDAIEQENNPLLVHLVAGCIAGAIEATATWPFEYIKTQLQLLHRPAKALLLSELPGFDEDGIIVSHETVQVVKCESADEEVEPDLPVPYTGMISGIVYTVKEHGFSALYHGLSPTLLGSIPKAGLRFGLFAWFSALLNAWQGKNLSLTVIYFLAGLGAGAVEALVVVTPVETIKTKCIQLNMSFLEGVREILILEGIRGIYHGLVPTVLKQGTNHGLRFLCYYEYKRIVTHDGAYDMNPFQSFLGGMIAGIFSTFGNQPFDVIKTKMQGVRAQDHYSSTWDCCAKTFAKDGIPGFYTGIVPRLSRVIPGQGIIFMSFEICVTILMALQKR